MFEKMARAQPAHIEKDGVETSSTDLLSDIATTVKTADAVYGVVESLAKIQPVQEALTKLSETLGRNQKGRLFMQKISKAIELVKIPKQTRASLGIVLPLIFAIHAGMISKDMDTEDMANALNRVYGQYQGAKRAEQTEMRRSSEFENKETNVTSFLDKVRPFVEQLQERFPIEDGNAVLQNASAFIFSNLFYPTNTGIARLSFTEGDTADIHGTEAWFYKQLGQMTGRNLDVTDLIAHLPPLPEHTSSTAVLDDLDAEGLPKALPLRTVVARSAQYIEMKKRIFEIYASSEFHELQTLSEDTGYLMQYEILIDGDIAQEVSPALYARAVAVAKEDPDFFRHIFSQIDPRTGVPFA